MNETPFEDIVIGLEPGDILEHDIFGDLTIIKINWNKLGYNVILGNRIEVFIPFLKVIQHCKRKR